MAGYSVQFFPFAKNMGEKIGKNRSKNLSGKCSQKLQKTTEPPGDLIGNKIANKFSGVSKNLQQINSKTVTNEHDKEIPNEKYVSPVKKKQEVIDELTLK